MVQSEEYPKIIKSMRKEYKPERKNESCSLKGGFSIDSHAPVREMFNQIKSQYPSMTRDNVIRADVISALIGGGVEPDLAFSSLEFSTKSDDSKRLAAAVNRQPFEFFKSREHLPAFSLDGSGTDDVSAITKIYESSETPETKTESNENEPKTSETQKTETNEKIENCFKGGSKDLGNDSSSESSESESEQSESDQSSESDSEYEPEKNEQNEIKNEQIDETENEGSPDDDAEPTIGGAKKTKGKKSSGKSKGKKRSINFKKWF